MKNGEIGKVLNDKIFSDVKKDDLVSCSKIQDVLDVNNNFEIDSIISPNKKFVKAVVNKNDDLEKDDVLLSFSFDSCNEVAVIKSDIVSQFSLVEDALGKELDVYFDNSKKKLDDLKIEQDEVIKNVSKIFDSKELEDEAILLDDLLIKLDSLRKQFQILNDSLNFDEIYRLGNTYFDDLVNKYANILNNDVVIRKQMDTIRNSSMYLEIVKSIKEMEEDNLNISLLCKLKRDEYEQRDNDFYLTSDKILEIDDISKRVDAFIIEEEKIIKDLDWKIKNSTSTYEQVQYVVEGNNRALRHLLMAVAASSFIDNKGIKTAFLVGETLRFMSAVMSPSLKEERTLKLEVIDYSSEIERAFNDVDAVRRQLTDMKKQIKDITEYFDKNFKEYVDVIPEYKEVLVKLQLVTDVIDEQCDLVELSNKSLEEEYVANYEKVKLKQDY